MTGNDERVNCERYALKQHKPRFTHFKIIKD